MLILREKLLCNRRELLARVKAIKHFWSHLYGRPFLLWTDYTSHQWVCQWKEPNYQVARWLETLAKFQYTLEHWARLCYRNANRLSRQTSENCWQCELIELKRQRTNSQERCQGEPELIRRTQGSFSSVWGVVRTAREAISCMGLVAAHVTVEDTKKQLA